MVGGSRRRPAVWLDGRFLPLDAPFLNIWDLQSATRAGFYVDAPAFGTRARMLDAAFQLMTLGYEQLHLEPPPYLTLQALDRAITDLLNKNRYFKSALVRITVFLRYEEDVIGIRLPTTSVLLEARDQARDGFPVHSGRRLAYFRDEARILDGWHGLDRMGDPLAWGASRALRNLGVDDVLLLNAEGGVAGGLSGALFLVKGERFKTPSVAQGARRSLMRGVVCGILRELGYEVEVSSVSPDEVSEADELFIVSVAEGIIPVLRVEARNYFLSKSTRLAPHINRRLFPEIFNR